MSEATSGDTTTKNSKFIGPYNREGSVITMHCSSSNNFEVMASKTCTQDQ